ncbi:MAG: 2-dehydropantoate 2-reductase [Gammaproteobacteria bacterium]|nr:2-dehydropantoate 2-reductase [Gammaproteobacteria bacterium]
MRIVVYGTGGAGGYFGAQLALSGEQVTFVARGEHLKALRSNGLRLETPSGDTVIRPVEATDDPTEVVGADVVLVGVKAWQVLDAAEAIRPIVGRGTFVVPLQNGVEAASQLSAVLGADHVLAGLCGTLSRVAGPGHIQSAGGQNFIKFGELDNRGSERVERLQGVFAKAEVSVEAPSDIVKAQWDKFLMVTAFGGVGAITRAPIGVTRSVPETRRLLGQCLEEVVAVARARKIAMSATAAADIMKFYDGLPPGGTTSLQRDIVDGKPSELEYWNGAVVRLGREAQVPTPTHALIYDCLLPQELRARCKITLPG